MDARELKEYILENNYVEQILDAIHCHHIKFHGDYWTCGNPDGDNTGAIVIIRKIYHVQTIRDKWLKLTELLILLI